ncbi:STAS domain-containing protein [Bermanella marisrubri]|uniref:Anti-anti-sigma regulatory factor (Antagonist of anti-sigma factor) n=1 Tax=Bermanella marisrubri TaxID=207949 RepID=Q1N0N4_9GAMM|nr:STAS domain-containing protein [Bermanella marisrubri]EAT11799.1 Anti-anti-sigma regulatory factor (antagonist of anti-sigma factor) [Oceanobacter sp. RED65] [Bermanella marisrubri]QIZ83834.1 STAS domain-containing protein [Bermanella marisrubri]
MNPGKILVAQSQGIYIVKFLGDVRLNLCSTLDQYTDQMFADEFFKTVIIDLTETDCIDSTCLGQLAKISILYKEKYGQLPTIVSTRDDVNRILTSMGFDQVFYIVNELVSKVEYLEELPEQTVSEEQMKKQVLQAHKLLMDMNENNRDAFQDLVKSLEEN